MVSGLFIVIAITTIFIGCEGTTRNDNLRQELFRPTMAPNSKFLNPHLDDDANLQLAIAAFADTIDDADTGDILSKPSDVKFENRESFPRRAKNLNTWNAITLLNGILAKRSKNY